MVLVQRDLAVVVDLYEVAEVASLLPSITFVEGKVLMWMDRTRDGKILRWGPDVPEAHVLIAGR